MENENRRGGFALRVEDVVHVVFGLAFKLQGKRE